MFLFPLKCGPLYVYGPGETPLNRSIVYVRITPSIPTEKGFFPAAMYPSLVELLDEQYTLTENYANAQTKLLNLTRTHVGSTTTRLDSGDIAMAGSGLYNAREQVRSNFECIQNHPSIAVRYPEHIALTRRVLQTISRNPTWAEIGIPIGNLDSIQTYTVALATLKASIAQVQIREAETNSPPLP